jgi:hypothetical protein
MSNQTMIPGTVPKLGPIEKMLLSLVAVERDAETVKDRAKKRKDELIAAATKAGMHEVKALDATTGELRILDIRAEVKVKRSTVQTVQVDKVESYEKRD